MRFPVSRRLLGAGAALVTALVTVAALLIATPATAATAWPGHPGRHLVRHVVRPGETAIGLAVTYHAWTRELLALNHLGMHSRLRVGQVVIIPVVNGAGRTNSSSSHSHPTSGKPWRHTYFSRTKVRQVVTDTARRHGVPSDLALAIAWQESGWQQRLISSAGAAGVMQMMPATGTWMSSYAGRRLNIYGTYDNVLGGVMLLQWLQAHTARDRNAIAAYYQGLGSVQKRGFFTDTKRYVRSVTAIREHLRRTGTP